MPTFLYACPKGHVTERVFISYRERTATTRCQARRCGRRSRYNFGLTSRATQVIADIPEHMNDSIGMVVRGRRHLKALQHEFGFQDYEKGAQKQSSDWREKGLPAARAAEIARAADAGHRRYRHERGTTYFPAPGD